MTVTNLLSDLPDLIVSDITPTVTEVSWGETIDISWTVTNQGTGNTTSYWYDNIYFSVDENFDPNEDTSVGEWWDYYGDNLVAGSSYTNSTTITLPSSPIEGVNSGYLLVVSDIYNNYQLETDENNNVSAVAIDPATNVTIAVTDVDDDVLPQLAIAPTNAVQPEGNQGLTPFTFTVTRTGDNTGTSSARWEVTGTGNNPANAADFPGGAFPSGTVTFAPGVTSQVITVNVQGDTVAEPNETFTVSLSEATNATITTATATATILDNDTISLLQPGRNEGLLIQEQRQTADINGILGRLRADIPGAQLYVPPLSFTARPLINGVVGDVFPTEIVQIEVDFAERPPGTLDYFGVAKQDEDGSFFL
ncbi:Calx-beta domain-containing protein, partial [Anabaena sp. CS-542/02]|uniref:Calx-beta domain-containing protein n=1 Tax=Anabaena sp. CS-542/02 TaxID=3021719 RepID=UPI00232CD2C9